MSNERQQRAARAEQMRKEREKADRKQRNFITVGIVTIVIALIAVGAWGVSAASKDNKKNTELVQPANATDDYGIVYDAAAAGATPAADAKPVSVELYEDFQCPACLAFEQENSALLKSQVESGAITVTYRPFSFLDDLGGSPNEYSRRSTNVAVCALDKGGVADYVKVHDYLYANQPDEGTAGPENAELISAVKDLGITGIDECVKTEHFGPWIEKAKDEGTKNKVGSTPTVLVAGKVVENPSQQTLVAAITAAAKA